MNHENAKSLLTRVFGFETFRNGQEKVINILLSGRSALAVFQPVAVKVCVISCPRSVLKD